MKKTKYLVLTLILVSLTNAYSQNRYPFSETGKLELPSKYRLLLVQEMIQIDSAMQKLVPLMVKGESEKASETALKIHNSFILKSALSKKELKNLKSLLPNDFIKMDRYFHRSAKKLSEALKINKLSESTNIYGKMLNACIGCHSKYAHNRFPELIKNNRNKNKSN
ncbi:hypothetical protein BMS3Abin04_01541 [bacterium BMS3Abin04]|nr:hypothetical protein BMS3Abin04_01541 [bacterium BMS3Abin04]